jgi:hypothetical protein
LSSVTQLRLGTSQFSNNVVQHHSAIMLFSVVVANVLISCHSFCAAHSKCQVHAQSK